MGLLQKAVETYDCHSSLVGVVRDGHAMLAPVGHTVTSAGLEISINGDGEFISSRIVDKSEPKIIIPVTEDSAGRTSSPAPHPLCEQLGYLSGKDVKKYDLYVEQLSSWAISEYSHPIVIAVLQYILKKQILADLAHAGINVTDDKTLVRWRVIGIGDEGGACWENKKLFNCFFSWYMATRCDDITEICMVTGKEAIPAKQHPKGIIAMNGNAKLISANDSSNFTYRGRFTEDLQSASVSFLASQKAHNALRWVASEQGISLVFGGRTFLCWNPQGKKLPHPTSRFFKNDVVLITPTDYKTELRNTLSGFKTDLPANGVDVIIAAFDAATTGRLSLTYYNELHSSDFLQRLYNWDKHCCWWRYDFKQKSNTISQPNLLDIVNCAFGTQRTEKGSVRLFTDDGILKQYMQKLMSCRVDCAGFPRDVLNALVNRASEPQSYDYFLHENILFTACAVIKKYHYDYFKEELEMSLDKSRDDSSYQFGRLLAVFEKVERDTYTDGETREANAIKLQSVFRRHPLHTANQIEDQLERAYFPRLSVGSRMYYKNLIGEITGKINAHPESWNKALGDTYLIGYYLQRSELYNKVRSNNEEE